MAFNFNWTEFDDHFHEEAKKMVTVALNKGNKPARIKDDIQVKELHMGTQPPELEMLEIGELSAEKFRGIFKLTYTGDAYIVLQTKVQANPVNERRSELSIRAQSHIVAADTPLVVPMQLRISDLRLRGFIGLVVCKRNGVTLSFKNDPLEQVKVSSTFDGLTSVQRFLQDEIEKQLRSMFQEDLPTLVHNLSRRFLDNERLREQEKASAIRHADSNQPGKLHVNTDKARSLPGSRTHTGARPSFFSQPTSPIAELPVEHRSIRVCARDAHSMPDRLPGQARTPSARSSNSSSTSSSTSRAKERYHQQQHATVQHRTVRFSEDLYMHQRSLSADGKDLERNGDIAMQQHRVHTQSQRIVHQQSVTATASNGIYHSFAPLFHEKGLRELAETRSAVGVSGEASSAYRPRIVHSSSAVAMPVTAASTSSKAKDFEPTPNGHNTPPTNTNNGRQRSRSQLNGVSRIRTTFYTSPTSSRLPTRPTSPLSEPFDITDRIYSTNSPLPGSSRNDDSQDNVHDPFNRNRSINDDILPRSIVLQPNDSRHAAQLATLFSTNHTLSPYTRPVGHFTTRSTMCVARSSDAQAKASRRTVVGKGPFTMESGRFFCE